MWLKKRWGQRMFKKSGKRFLDKKKRKKKIREVKKIKI